VSGGYRKLVVYIYIYICSYFGEEGVEVSEGFELGVEKEYILSKREFRVDRSNVK
jgi:hypothetical protein